MKIDVESMGWQCGVVLPRQAVTMCVDSSVVIDKQIKAAGAVTECLYCRGVVVFVPGRKTSRYVVQQ